MKEITLEMDIPIRNSHDLLKTWIYKPKVTVIVDDDEEINDIGNMDGFGFKIIKEEKF